MKIILNKVIRPNYMNSYNMVSYQSCRGAEPASAGEYNSIYESMYLISLNNPALTHLPDRTPNSRDWTDRCIRINIKRLFWVY